MGREVVIVYYSSKKKDKRKWLLPEGCLDR